MFLLVDADFFVWVPVGDNVGPGEGLVVGPVVGSQWVVACMVAEAMGWWSA